MYSQREITACLQGLSLTVLVNGFPIFRYGPANTNNNNNFRLPSSVMIMRGVVVPETDLITQCVIVITEYIVNLRQPKVHIGFCIYTQLCCYQGNEGKIGWNCMVWNKNSLPTYYIHTIFILINFHLLQSSVKSFPFWQRNVKVEPLPQWNVKLVLKRHNPIHYDLHYFENLTSLVKRCYVVKVIARWRLFSREKYSNKESVLRACIIVCCFFFSLI